MRRTMLAGALALGAVGPAAADAVEDAMAAALKAYRAGDMATAKEELDLAAALMDQAEAEGLAAFLPEAMDGWTKTESEASATPALMFGGGFSASAIYESAGDTVEIELFANNPMVAAMAPMLASPQLMAAAGEVRRVRGQRYVVTPDGQAMALVDGRILVRVSGSASENSRIAYFEAIDFEALAGF
jgi:hypothetical protein